MLYITTRDNKDAFTAHRVLHSDLAPDGGLFVPFRLPVYSGDEIKALSQKNFGQVVADILNLFFSTQLTGWDVDLCIGRSPVKTVSLGQKILVSEMYHNPAADFRYASDNLYQKLVNDGKLRTTEWFEIAVRIAVLFGVFSEIQRDMMSNDMFKLDVPVRAEDPAMSSAVWYARQMGLPIGTIIFCCEEDSAFWDILRRGVCNTGLQCTAETVCRDTERLIHNVFGFIETQRFLHYLTQGSVYTANEEQVATVKSSTFVAAISKNRLGSVVNSVKRTDSYQIGSNTAYLFGGLQDYRSSIGESRTVLILIEEAANK